jgi:hypothetical protein
VPLEETKIRLEAARDAVKEVVEGAKPAIGPEEAAQLQKTLDEGLAEVSRRIAYLEITEVEGWSVAKQKKNNCLMMELPDDLQKQLKQARKDAKSDEAEKDKKKGGQKSKGYHPYLVAMVSVGVTVALVEGLAILEEEVFRRGVQSLVGLVVRLTRFQVSVQ